MKEHLLDYLSQSKTKYVRGLRILLEYFYATEIFESITKSKTKIISVFGSARTLPGTFEFEEAKKLGMELYQNGFAVVTGASTGIMQAANEGVANAILKEIKKHKTYKNKKDDFIKNSSLFKNKLKNFSAGLKITLPHESIHNPFVGVYATFHYFMVRKFFFGTLSSAFIACEGGWGTRDEMFEILTLVQTGKSPLLPIIYICQSPEHLTQDFDYCLEKKYISQEDLYLIDIVPNNQKAIQIIKNFYKNIESISYQKFDDIEIVLQKHVTATMQKQMAGVLKKNFSQHFNKFVFGRNRLFIHGFSARSYGVLKQIINTMNRF